MRFLQFFVVLSVSAYFLIVGNGAKPKTYNIEQFLNATDRELRAHKQQLDVLQKKGELNITPSQAQLFYPDPVRNRKRLEGNLLC